MAAEIPVGIKAYAAGLLDGEGSIQINPSKGSHGKRYWCLTVQVSSNNKDVLDWLRGYFGGSITAWKSKKSTQAKTSYNWRLYAKAAENLLVQLLGYLHIKKDQAKTGLKFLKYKKLERLTEERIAIRNELAKEMRELNRRYGKATVRSFPEDVL